MTGKEIIEKVKALNLPSDSYVVDGSCPMAIAGLRESNDIDLLVSKELFEQLRERGWREHEKGPDDKPLVYDVFEAHSHWDFSPYVFTLEQLLKTVTIVEGIPFASLQEVRNWKAAAARPKDLKDIELIDAYLQSKNDRG
ncbi:MAG TPA: hypothetical protein VJG64_02015 [Candidatus Paceibacterota bacterium]